MAIRKTIFLTIVLRQIIVGVSCLSMISEHLNRFKRSKNFICGDEIFQKFLLGNFATMGCNATVEIAPFPHQVREVVDSGFLTRKTKVRRSSPLWLGLGKASAQA